MKNLYLVYRRIKDWAILDTKIIHAYDEIETPIKIVKVIIGNLHYEREGIDHKPETRRTPIIRWITQNQFENLKMLEGEII